MPPIEPATLYASSNALASHYGRFRVAERLLLTGHSHQAWPDRAFDGVTTAFEDAAEWVDEKWKLAFARADRVRRGFARLLDDAGGLYALGTSTHDLLVGFLSALPLRDRPRLVTTDSEFHSARRQLARLAEEGIEIAQVPAHPVSTTGDRLALAVDDRTAAVITSTVYYSSGQIAEGLQGAMAACLKHGALLFLDVYHQLNVVPFSLRSEGLERAFVVGGGYKYCQLGEGNCFLRFPADCALRPLVTGWYAEFDRLDRAAGDEVSYGGGGARFAGATYDPTSHYRAAEVFDFFEEMGLTPPLLREVSQHQVGLLCHLFDRLDLDPALICRDRDVPLARIGGFLALRSPRAAEFSRRLEQAGVYTDARGDALRLGPAPYLCDRQLEESMALLAEVARGLERKS